MKRLLFLLLVASLLFSALIFSTLAADYETDASFWSDVELRALYVQSGMKLASRINPSFSVDWPTFKVPEAGGVAATSNFNMRGFAMSPDGRYTYMSVLHGGGDIVRGMFVMETQTGRITDYRTRYDGDRCNGAQPRFSYPKGVAADTRGYVYIGWTLSDSYNAAYLTVECQKADGTLETVAELPVCTLGTPGDPAGTKIGINGVDVVELDGKTYCYVMTNYAHDVLYRFDVTDPEKPVLDKHFGKGGMATAAPKLAGGTLDEGLYMDVAPDGNIYLATGFSNGRDGIAVLAPDGRSCARVIPLDGVYSVELAGEFLLCGMRTANAVTVLDHESGRQIATLSTKDSFGERITRMQIIYDVLFVCDAGSFENQGNAVYAAALSETGEAFLQAIVKGQNTGESDFSPETEAETVTGTADTSDSATEASPEPTVPSESTAPSPKITTAEPGMGSGCASSMAVIPLLALLPVAFHCRKKHKK